MNEIASRTFGAARIGIVAMCILGTDLAQRAEAAESGAGPLTLGVAIGDPSAVVAAWRPWSSRLVIGGDLAASFGRLVSCSTHCYGLSRVGAGAAIGGRWTRPLKSGISLAVQAAGGARLWFLDYRRLAPVFDVALRLPVGLGGISSRGTELFLEAGPSVSLTGLGVWLEGALTLRFPI